MKSKNKQTREKLTAKVEFMSSYVDICGTKKFDFLFDRL